MQAPLDCSCEIFVKVTSVATVQVVTFQVGVMVLVEEAYGSNACEGAGRDNSLWK